MRSPGPVTLILVGIAAFAGAFGVARAAGGEGSSKPATTVQARPLALRTATELPDLSEDAGPTAAELQARREVRARKEKLAKERKARERAEKRAAREEKLRVKAEQRAQRIAEQEAERKAVHEYLAEEGR